MKDEVIRIALLKLLQPIASWCVRHGLKQQDFSELGKRAFVLAANNELERKGQKHSVSRVSVMTGLQRKDITRLAQTATDQSGTTHFLTKIIGQWCSDSDYLTSKGKSRVLTLDEFNDLVQSISSDVNPYTALFELERTATVEKIGNKVRLAMEAYRPAEDLGARLSLMAEDVGTLIEAVDQNTFEKHDLPNLHVKTYYDNICQDKVEQIKTWILEHGERYHKELREYLSKYDKDLNPTLHSKAGGVTVTVGSFSQVKKPKPPEQD